MFKKKIILSVLLLSILGCNRSEGEKYSVRYYEDGRAKAVVTIVPVYDQNEIKLPWSLAADLTQNIKLRLERKGNAYLTSFSSSFDYDENFSKNKPSDIHRSSQIAFEELKKKYPGSEFIVLLELAEHRIHPKISTTSLLDKITPSMSLDISMRVRIVDLRGDDAKVILQEMVQQSHLIPKQFAKLDFDSHWGKKTYSITPIGFAHSQFTKEVSERIDHYLVLAKTH